MPCMAVLVLFLAGTFAVNTSRTLPVASGITRISKDNPQKRLVEDLFDGHFSNARPVLRNEENVTVQFGMSLHQIIDMDERNEMVKISLWVRQVWYNPFHRWNKSYYGNIEQINVKPGTVWTPDIFLYNSADAVATGSMAKSETEIKVNSDGRNVWLSPVITSSSCKIKVKFFPFDEQDCILKFGSWTYDGFQLDLVTEALDADIKSFVSNGEWDLVGVSLERNEVKYVCCEAPFPVITLTIHIRRRALYYLFNLVIPCLVIVGLTALSFYLPPESGERISLVITNLLAMTVFMLIVAELIPPTSDEVSIISIFYSCCIFEVGIALLGTCIILKCHFANPEISTMPRWLRFVVIDCMGRFLVTTQKPWKRKTERQQMLKLGNDISRDEAVKNRCRQCDRKISEPPISTLSSNGSPGGLTLRAREISFDIASSNDSSKTDSIANELRDGEDRFTKSLEEGAKAQVEHGLHEKERAEWMYIAAVLDRLFLWLFILSVVISTVVCYFKIPTNYDITGSH